MLPRLVNFAEAVLKVAMKTKTTKTLKAKSSMKASKKVPAKKDQEGQKTKAMKAMKVKATRSTESTKRAKTTALGAKAAKVKMPIKKPSAKTPSKTKVPQRSAQAYARTVASDIILAPDLRSFKKAVKQLSDVNILQEKYGEFILSYASDRQIRKLEILLTAGLNANMPGLLRRCVLLGASACVKLLLEHGADPLVGDPTHYPNVFFMFELCAHPCLEGYELEQAQAVLLELKKFLFRSPRYAARASELWRDAIEHMNEAYVHHFDRQDRKGRIWYKKWLRDNLLQIVDAGYRVSP